MRRFPNARATLAGEWREWEASLSVEYPTELLSTFVRPVFYSGALAALAILANGGRSEAVFAELEAFARDEIGLVQFKAGTHET